MVNRAVQAGDKLFPVYCPQAGYRNLLTSDEQNAEAPHFVLLLRSRNGWHRCRAAAQDAAHIGRRSARASR